jgi:uncharacterized protein (TIGR03435 family)
LRASTPIELPIPVRALITPGAGEPGIVGFLRPVLVLPAQLLERLNPRQLGAILTHEMCHVRRRDNFFAAVHMAVEAIFWFHPLVWWIGSHMVEERELACDEEVLRMGCEPADYVEGILKVCRLYRDSLLPCVSRVTGADVKRRLRAVLGGSIALELTLGKKAVLAAAGLASLAAPILVGVLKTPILEAQSTSVATSKWEAVSIRPCEPGSVAPGGRSGGMGVSPQRLHVTCWPLDFLIQATYTFANDRNKLVLEVNSNGLVPVSGGPAWMRSERYDIEAKAEGNPTAREMQGPMLRALLEDRFKLKVHLEAREGPVYELTVAKSGFKLQPMKEGSCIPLDLLNLQTKMMADPKATLAEFANACHNGGIQRGSPMWTAEFQGTDLDEVARWLTRGLDRPVVNKTGISGLFHFQFAFSPDPSAPGYVPSDDPPGGPSIFAAIQTAAGLKLEPTKGLVQHIVVDSAERPSEN